MAKTVLLTGGGRGLGRITAEKLAVAGHRVLLTARTSVAAQTAVDQIRQGRGQLRVEPRAVDLSSLQQVRDFATAEAARGDAIDVLFHIAGIMQTSKSRRVTVDGYEETLAVNALAPFLLTALLRPALELAPAARVVTVSSRMHLPGSRGAPVDFDFNDPQLQRGYNPDRAYKNSKLAVLWFTYELQRRLAGTAITANAVCPGFVPTTAAASTTGPMRLLMTFASAPHAVRDVSRPRDRLVRLHGAGPLARRSRRRVSYGERHPIESSPQSRDVEQARRFWRLAERLTGLT